MTVIVQKEMLKIRQICWLNVPIIVFRQEENYRKFIQPQEKKISMFSYFRRSNALKSFMPIDPTARQNPIKS